MRFVIYGKRFINQTLSANWYKDQTCIHDLVFSFCDLKIIERNVFVIKQFNDLWNLTFLDLPSLQIRSGAFDGLPNLRRLIFHRLQIVNANYRFMDQIANKVESLVLQLLQQPLNMYNILGALPLPQLMYLTIRKVDIYVRFTSNSITNAPNLEILSLNECGIEVLEKGCFNGFPLISAIRLGRNKLKTLPVNIFKTLVLYLEFYHLMGNPWECDCSLAYFIREYPGILDAECNDDETYNFYDQCQSADDGANSMSSKCSDHFGTNSLRITYTTKFLIKIDYTAEHIFLKSQSRRKLYLLTFAARNAYGDAVCWTTTAKYSAIALNRISSVGTMPTICALDMQEKVWPLNCISFRGTRKTPDRWLSDEDKPLVLSTFVILGIMVFLASVGGGTLIPRRNLILLRGINRVIVQRSRKSNRVDTVLVMPATWENSQKEKAKSKMNLERSKSIGYKEIYMELPEGPKYYSCQI